MANKEIRLMNFAADDNFDIIVDQLATLAANACAREYPKLIKVEVMNSAEYNELNEKVKAAMVAYAADKAGISVKDETEMLFAADNKVFVSVLNSIEVRALARMMVRYDNPQIGAIADIETVKAGNSRTYEIDTKSLPVPQKGNYQSNITNVPPFVKSSVTLTPKVWTAGVSLDFIRLLANGYDWGFATARIYAGFIVAQYKVVVAQVFNTTILNGTPLYNATFALNTYTQLAEDIGMLNGGGANDVVALGTRVAFNTISGTATSGGFMTKDEYIRDSYLKEICGIPSVVMEQFTDFSIPFTSANAASLRAIPQNLIVLISQGKDKIVKLLREDYIRVQEIDARDNTLNRMEYSYSQAFDAGIATASHFGVQNTGA